MLLKEIVKFVWVIDAVRGIARFCLCSVFAQKRWKEL